jgi:hypothetical protein
MKNLIGIFAALTALLSPLPALAGYDGLWQVNIVTTRGSCDTTSMALAISNGIVVSRDPSVLVSGQVVAGGNVTVSLTNSRGTAVGTGRQDDAAGFGTWRGGPCAGTWTAQRN